MDKIFKRDCLIERKCKAIILLKKIEFNIDKFYNLTDLDLNEVKFKHITIECKS